MDIPTHPAASDHLPFFITQPGHTDVLFVFTAILIVAAIAAAGIFFFWLHSLPERMVHNKIQFDVVAVLALLSLVTHIHAFWVAALILALVRFPDFSMPDFSGALGRIAGSLEKMAEKPNESVAEPPSTVPAEPFLKVNDRSRSRRNA